MLGEHYSFSFILQNERIILVQLHNTTHSPGSRVDFNSMRNLLHYEAIKEYCNRAGNLSKLSRKVFSGFYNLKG